MIVKVVCRKTGETVLESVLKEHWHDAVNLHNLEVRKAKLAKAYKWTKYEIKEEKRVYPWIHKQSTSI